MPVHWALTEDQGLVARNMPYLLYIASLLGAAALLLMMPRRGYTPPFIGALLGAATLGGLWLYVATNFLPPVDERGLPQAAWVYQYIFSALAIGSAVRVITHPRPVYAALWFVMVVLASAGLFLLLDAEFMAFAMVIIYAGAILVTYVFVIMLASQASDEQETPEYDRVAREPLASVAVGFLLLAVLLTAAFPTRDDQLMQSNALVQARSDAELISEYLPNRPAHRLAEVDPTVSLTQLYSAERTGLDLFRGHPLGLELAGVILLVSLVGAVVIARTKLPPSPGMQG